MFTFAPCVCLFAISFLLGCCTIGPFVEAHRQSGKEDDRMWRVKRAGVLVDVLFSNAFVEYGTACHDIIYIILL